MVQLIRLLAAALVVAALCVVGTLDAQDERAQHAHQCQMIDDGHWPKSVNPNCKGD